jgi:hypothetical protein
VREGSPWPNPRLADVREAERNYTRIVSGERARELWESASPNMRRWIERAEELNARAKRRNTRLAFASDVRDYMAFCATNDVEPLAPTLAQWRAYVISMLERPGRDGPGWSPDEIQRRLSQSSYDNAVERERTIE